MKKKDYKRLGDYIRIVDVRNKELRVTKLLGVSISKEFIPSIANTIGTNMRSYKIVCKGQFAYGPVTSRNGDKISIALLDEEEAIISQAYSVFEVIDIQKLLPEYLMMWFKRPEFDRYARYKSHGSAREIFDWEEMCNVYLPVPPIEKQRKIVSDYETLARRIKLNEQMIQKLEDTAQTIYRKMFVDDIDLENLPEGWKIGKVAEIATLSQGIQIDIENQFYCKSDGMERFLRIIDYTPNTNELPRYVYIKDKRYYCDKSDIVIIRYGDAGTICRRLEGVIANNLFNVSSMNYKYL